MKKFSNWIILGTIVILFLALRLPQILRDEFPFVFDFGRDLIWVRNMVELKKITLIGPWGSLAGVYMGPGWYYFLAIPYIISGGDPRASVVAVMLVNLAALLAGTWFLKKEISPKTAIIFAFLYALSPHNINITTYPFHANMLPATATAMLIAMYYFMQGKTKYIWIAALATSLNFHFEPAAGIFTTLTLFIFLMWQRKKLLEIRLIRSIRNLFVAFFIPFVPQLIFELRHNFMQTRAALSYFQGKNESLEGKLPFFERIIERLRKFSELFSASTMPHLPWIIAGIILLCLFILLYKFKKTQNETSLLYLIYLSLAVPLLGFMFLFPPELKGWYMYGFTISYFLLIALFLGKLSSRPLILYSSFIIIYLFWVGQLHNRLFNPISLTGPEILKTQIQTLEKVYAQSEGKPFSLYVYTPPVYDYQYQYLVWWLGKNRGYTEPVEYSYQQNEIIYHPEKQNFITASDQKPSKIFLLMEPESDQFRLQGWLGHFASYPFVAKTVMPSGISLETRNPSP